MPQDERTLHIERVFSIAVMGARFQSQMAALQSTTGGKKCKKLKQ